jgi:hypothetical protein
MPAIHGNLTAIIWVDAHQPREWVKDILADDVEAQGNVHPATQVSKKCVEHLNDSQKGNEVSSNVQQQLSTNHSTIRCCMVE